MIKSKQSSKTNLFCISTRKKIIDFYRIFFAKVCVEHHINSKALVKTCIVFYKISSLCLRY